MQGASRSNVPLCSRCDAADRSGRIPCQWFKLHLHPSAMNLPVYDAGSTERTKHPFRSLRSAAPLEPPSPFEIPSLPENVTIERVYSELIKYLFNNAKVRSASHSRSSAAHDLLP